jgi:hypothetical protein
MHSPDGIVHFDSSTVSDFKKEICDLNPISARQIQNWSIPITPSPSPPKAAGLFVRQIRFRHQQPDDQDRAQCYPSNADKSNRATKISDDKAVVLSDAPVPAKVPTKPWARLDRPVPWVRSATIAVSIPSTLPLIPSSS